MTLQLLSAYLLAVMIHFTPLADHSFYETPDVTLARYVALSETIAEGVLAEPMSDAEKVKVGVVMVSIGDMESNWRSDVVSCEKAGDHGLAWGPWQTQLPKDSVCRSLRQAFSLALGMVRRSFLICKELPVGDRLSWYTDGGAWSSSPERRARSSRRSRLRIDRALRWVNTHPFTFVEAP